jgi:hypothetical protein
MSASPSSTAPSLRGKTVAVQARSRAGAGPIVLSDCFLETRGDRLFLVGTSQPAQRSVSEWSDGVRRAIAWDAVEEYFLFDALEDYYARAHAAAALAPLSPPNGGMPEIEWPQSDEGNPVEPSGVQVQPETPLEVGTIVLSFSQGRWWRAEVIGLEGDDQVRIHYPGWDAKWDVTVPKTELQVDLSSSIKAEE